MASIMTALWFEHLRGPDRVSVKPHASPVVQIDGDMIADAAIDLLDATLQAC